MQVYGEMDVYRRAVVVHKENAMMLACSTPFRSVPAAPLSPPSPPPHSPSTIAVDPCQVVVVGSGVAAGVGYPGAIPSKGWAGSENLGEALNRTYALNLTNVAEKGKKVDSLDDQLENALTVYRPRVVIFGLSLANEGLRDSADLSAANDTAQHYLQGLRAHAQRAEQAGATVIIGGVYPHSQYDPWEVEVLRQTDATLKTWPYEYLDFMSATSDADGDWKTGLKSNDGHPNNDGHKAMFNAIDLDYFAQFACNVPPPSPSDVPPPSPSASCSPRRRAPLVRVGLGLALGLGLGLGLG